MITAIDAIHLNNKKILYYGWINFPLGYTQVATFAVYAYFAAELFVGQFFVHESKMNAHNSTISQNVTASYDIRKLDQYWIHFPDVYIPVYSILEFISYMGWIKLAESLLNPWGEDDEV